MSITGTQSGSAAYDFGCRVDLVRSRIRRTKCHEILALALGNSISSSDFGADDALSLNTTRDLSSSAASDAKQSVINFHAAAAF
ncbi:hypothetical protein ACLOJK_033499 [Asimina triloba]